jgi:hypothetical protein
MNQGILIFAHNSRTIDYARLAIISGLLASRHLKKPVSLVSDETTVDWMKESNIYKYANLVFENIIITDKPELDNFRKLNNGQIAETIPFFNKNRSTAWNLSPYNQTLLIDSDFLIGSNSLNNYWGNGVKISSAIKDACIKDRMMYHDRYISDTGIKLYWATTVMFDKSQESRLFFDLVNYIKLNYTYYADLFRFNSQIYRNDFAFSIAKHILDGFLEENTQDLPPVLSVIDKDILVDIKKGPTVLITNDTVGDYYLGNFKNLDLHVMNKQSIVKHFDQFIELI